MLNEIPAPHPRPSLLHRNGKALNPSQAIPRILKSSATFFVVAIVFGSIFGIRLSEDFSLSLSLIALYLLPAALIFCGNATVNPVNLVMYACSLYLAIISLFAAPGRSISMLSLAYLAVIYLPLVLQARRTRVTILLKTHVIDSFLFCAHILAILAVIQFALQFIIKQPWIFDITLLLPRAITASGTWNTAQDTGSYFKANGFFILEPSGLSGMAALAIVLEITTYQRLSRLATYAMALLLSFSGTGIAFLIFALLIPTRPKGIIRALLFLVFGWSVIVALDSFILDGFFERRMNEFNTEGTSGYARYVAPVEIVKHGMLSVTTMLFGNGPGTILPTIASYPSKWEIHDPTWAKLLYEYGFVGGGALFLFIAFALLRAGVPNELKLGLMYAWIASGGQLLNPKACAIMFGLAILWPRQGNRTSKWITPANE